MKPQDPATENNTDPKKSVPPRLFKYVDHFGTEVIRNLQLKVTPPIELNDVFEMTPCLKPGVVTPDHIADLIRATAPADVYNEMKKNGQPLPPFEVFVQILNRVTPMYLMNGTALFQAGYEELAAEQCQTLSKSFGVICLTERENDVVMWAHYADSQRGMVLEFDSSHRYFRDNSRFERVCYTDSRVPFDPTLNEHSPELDDQCKRMLYTKQSAWSYESEWRSLFPLDWCHKKLHPHDRDRTLYFTDIPPELITRVILGLRCQNSVEEQLREARRNNLMNFVLCRAVMDSAGARLNYINI